MGTFRVCSTLPNRESIHHAITGKACIYICTSGIHSMAPYSHFPQELDVGGVCSPLKKHPLRARTYFTAGRVLLLVGFYRKPGHGCVMRIRFEASFSGRWLSELGE